MLYYTNTLVRCGTSFPFLTWLLSDWKRTGVDKEPVSHTKQPDDRAVNTAKEGDGPC